jgi:hypothetical protein
MMVGLNIKFEIECVIRININNLVCLIKNRKNYIKFSVSTYEI